MDKHLNVLEIVDLIMLLLEKNQCSYSEAKAVLDLAKEGIDSLVEEKELPYTEMTAKSSVVKKFRESLQYKDYREAIETITG